MASEASVGAFCLNISTTEFSYRSSKAATRGFGHGELVESQDKELGYQIGKYHRSQLMLILYAQLDEHSLLHARRVCKGGKGAWAVGQRIEVIIMHNALHGLSIAVGFVSGAL